ncbi:MAG TPA: response regulator, partial [Verrucomicrobiae bacterium]
MVLLMTGLACQPLNGATVTNKYEFQNSIPKPGSIQWEIDHEIIKARQEQHRKRLAIPPSAMGSNVPRAATAYLVNGRKMAPEPAPVPVDESKIVLHLLLFTAALVLTGVLFARKFAPEVLADLNQRFNPWALPPVIGRDILEQVRAEEAAFGKFLKSFRAGQSAAASGHSLEKEVLAVGFFARTKKRLVAQRKLIHDIIREPRDSARKIMLTNLCLEMGMLKDEAGFPGAMPVWQVASALEGLLKQLTGKISNVTLSTLRSVGGGLYLLDSLCDPDLKLDLLTRQPFKFLVVDDDLISRQALSLALKNAFSQPDLAVDGKSAQVQTAAQAYDVIFLDVQMPDTDGFELCMEIHDAGLNRNTPVVFVTGQYDFNARAKSTLSGGNDLMGKPFLVFELTVKALTLALQGRLHAVNQQPIMPPEPGRDKPDAPLPVADVPRLDVGSVISPQSPDFALAPEERDEVTATFLSRASKNLGPLREVCQTILQATDMEKRQALLADGFLRINSLVSESVSGTVHPAYQLSGAVEGLFRKLLENSKHSTPSTLATLAAAVDLLVELSVPGIKPDLAVDPPIQLLVVDDDLVARRAVTGALQTFFQKPESAENGELALALAAEKSFDVIFLDVIMPGMDGFAVCSKIRETLPNCVTP